MPFSIEKNARKFPRGVILAIATFLTLGNGLIYMWSIFNVPLMETFGYTASGVALAYSLFMLMSCVGSFLSGWLQQHMEQRFVVLIAGIIFSLGWLLSGFAESLPLLYLFFGGLAGTGNGLSYNALLSVATTWFRKWSLHVWWRYGASHLCADWQPAHRIVRCHDSFPHCWYRMAWYLSSFHVVLGHAACWVEAFWLEPQGTNCNLGRVFSTQLQRSGDLEATFILCSLSYIDGCCYEWTDDQRARVKPRSRARKSYCS